MEVNRVKVIKPFPGFEVGDELFRYKDRYSNQFVLQTTVIYDGDGLSYKYVDYPEIDRVSWRLDPATVKKHLGEYFEDITDRPMKTHEEVRETINKFIDAANSTKDSDEELIYRNIVYALEWVLGNREYVKE